MLYSLYSVVYCMLYSVVAHAVAIHKIHIAYSSKKIYKIHLDVIASKMPSVAIVAIRYLISGTIHLFLLSFFTVSVFFCSTFVSYIHLTSS